MILVVFKNKFQIQNISSNPDLNQFSVLMNVVCFI